MKLKLSLILFIIFSFSVKAQYSFSGQMENNRWENNVYLSFIEDYRKLSGVFSEQIISKHQCDSLGYFNFSGNQLDIENRIYRIHVDNCNDDEQTMNHFEGHCEDSREILFIAKNSDSIQFPFTFDKQMFCEVKSKNVKANAFVRIDSLKDEMKFAYSEFNSETSKKLNNKKWFKSLQDFGKQLNEPLAELSIYAFLSERGNNFHSYYLNDLKKNTYYDDLLSRLTSQYPNSPYTNQYEIELTSDKYSIQSNDEKSNQWIIYLIAIIGLISITFNIFIFSKWYKQKKHSKSNLKASLTKQEQNILQLLLEDKSNKDIAEALFVSVSTVKTHVNNVYKKLNVQTRQEVKNLFTN